MKNVDQLMHEFLKDAENVKVTLMAYGMADYLSHLDIENDVQAIKQLAAMLDKDQIYSSGLAGDNVAVRKDFMDNGIETMEKAIALVTIGHNVETKGIEHDDFPKTAQEVIKAQKFKDGVISVNGVQVQMRSEDKHVEEARTFVKILTSDPGALNRAIEAAQSVAHKIRAFLKMKEKEISEKVKHSLEALARKAERMSERLMDKCGIRPRENNMSVGLSRR